MMADLHTLLPAVLVLGLSLAVLLLGAFIQGAQRWLGYVVAGGLALALASTASSGMDGTAALTSPWFATRLSVDAFTHFGWGLLLIVGIFSALTAVDYLPEQGCDWPEFYSLLLFAVLGMMVMVSATELVTLFVGLEVMSIPIYVLAGFKRQSSYAVEAATKYFFLGAFATGFFLYGLAFAYGDTGSTEIAEIAAYYAANTPGAFALVAVVMLLVAFGFKVGGVPFHMWVPDVYEGAPTPVTGLMSTGVKIAGFLALTRVFLVAFGADAFQSLALPWDELVIALAALTMTVGNVLALVQRNVKRMLAYSSIAHAGYLLLGVLALDGAAGPSGRGLFFYLLGYALASLGAFAVAAKLGRGDEEDIGLANFSGLAYRSAPAALCMTLFMASLAGIPPTAGFLGKYLIFQEALTVNQDRYLWLVLLAVANSVVSVYYYLRVPVYMYMREPRRDEGLIESVPMTATYALTALAVVGFGTLPEAGITYAAKAGAAIVPEVQAAAVADAATTARRAGAGTDAGPDLSGEAPIRATP